MGWINNSLNRKFIAGTAAGLALSSLVFLILFITMYQKEILVERSAAVSQVNYLLQSSLENAMLKRDLDGLRDIIERLGEQDNITNVMIANPKGEIRFSSRSTHIGSLLDLSSLDLNSPTTQFLTDDRGNEVLRSTNPVANKPPCLECHGSISQNPVNGILFVDYEALSIKERARKTTLLLMGSGAIIVIINLIGGWWFIRRYVLKPVEHLSAACNQIAKGDLDTRVVIEGSTELAVFGQTFNSMAGQLQEELFELEERKDFLQALIDAIPDGVRIIDPDYNVLLANRAYRKQCLLDDSASIEDKCYKATHQLNHPCPHTLMTCPLHELANRADPIKVIHRHSLSDGTSLDVEVYAALMKVTIHGKPCSLTIESIRDLTQEVKFSHQQRLSELGRLSAGVAHEIYNPLTAIHLALHSSFRISAQEDVDMERLLHYLHIVDREVNKSISVTERMLKLSSLPPSLPEVVLVHSAVSETLSLLRWEAEKQNIEVITELDPTVRVLATDSEIRMLTLNLSQNSFHAMPDGGTLRVSLYSSDGEVCLIVNDSGVGISTEDLQQIYEPFFSRRAGGSKGTGLGLSICKNILKNYRGSIEVESQLGVGSTFTVRIPDADALTK